MSHPYAKEPSRIETIVGGVVEAVDPGTSGFVLDLRGKRWLMIFLDRAGRIRWKTGRGSSAKDLRKHGFSPFTGDGYCPPGDRSPRSHDFCDLGWELSRSKTARIQRLESTPGRLHLVFRGGSRLRAHVATDAVGRDVLRAFWDGRGDPPNPPRSDEPRVLG